jgi:hypothetical protein
MSKPINTGRQRLLLVCGMTAYVACFVWMYIHYLDATWAYFGFNYYPPSTKYVVLAWMFSLLPSLWMPIHLTRPSQLAYWVLYITVIIPSMFVPLFAGINPPTEVILVMIVFFVAFALTGSTYFFPLLPFRRTRLSHRAFWICFGCLGTVLVIWVLAVLHSHLHIVSFADIYDQRNAARDVGEGTAVSYALMGLTGAINPFLMGFGLYYRRYRFLAIGIVGQLLVYSALGTKGSILSIVFIPGVYAVLRVGRSPFGLKVAYGFLAVLAGLCLSLVAVGYDPSPLHFAVLFVILMRTLPMGGLVTAWYYNFFQQNPFTYYSHVTGVNWFVHYPYANFIGLEIGSFYQSGSDLDATAHFWATDGLEALGLSGVLLISVFCSLIFWVLDSAAKRHDPRLAALIATYAAYNFANISIFTTLFSGGLTLLIIFLYILPPRQIEFAPAWSKARKLAVTPRAAPSYGTG